MTRPFGKLRGLGLGRNGLFLQNRNLRPLLNSETPSKCGHDCAEVPLRSDLLLQQFLVGLVVFLFVAAGSGNGCHEHAAPGLGQFEGDHRYDVHGLESGIVKLVASFKKKKMLETE